MDYCKICKEMMVLGDDTHKCKPLWLCRIGDGSEDEEFLYKVYAYNEVAAAEKCAENEESNFDYAFVNDGEVDIEVQNPKTDEVKKFTVYAEPSVDYSAYEKEDSV